MRTTLVVSSVLITLLALIDRAVYYSKQPPKAPETRTIITEELVCNPDTLQLRVDFTLLCASSPPDDEDTDWLYACESMAEDYYCEIEPRTTTLTKSQETDWEWKVLP